MIVHLSDSFTRPGDTTTYGANDLVANSTTAGSVVPLSFEIPIGLGKTFKIRELHLSKSTATVANSSLTVHFYESSPTCTNGDNGAWLTTLSDYIGSITSGTLEAFSDGAAVTNAVGDANAPSVSLSSGASTIYALCEAVGAYAPGDAEVFTVQIAIEFFK